MKKRVYIILRFFYRLIKYKAERNKRVREIGIIIRQLLGLRKIKRDTPHLIIFFIPGLDYFTGKESISGGLISIISMVEESKKIFDKMNNIEVICCTYPNSHLLYKLKTFKNNTQIFSYSLVERYFNKVQGGAHLTCCELGSFASFNKLINGVFINISNLAMPQIYQVSNGNVTASDAIDFGRTMDIEVAVGINQGDRDVI